MAGDWIKVCHATLDAPEVLGIAESLGITTEQALGHLLRFWVWADDHSIDGHDLRVTKKSIDAIARIENFSKALLLVGWLHQNGTDLMVPNFDRHNGTSAKERVLARDRKQKERSRSERDENVTREEKRRVISKHPSDALSSPTRRPEDDVQGNPEGPERTAKVEHANGIPYQAIVDLYHQCMPNNPKCQIITAKRKGQIAARWRSGALPSLETWRIFFDDCARSKFLTGQVDPLPGHRRFVATLEWLTNESNYAKILEGKYHG